LLETRYGSMAELVDAPDSKSGHQCAWGLIKAKHTAKKSQS